MLRSDKEVTEPLNFRGGTFAILISGGLIGPETWKVTCPTHAMTTHAITGNKGLCQRQKFKERLEIC